MAQKHIINKPGDDAVRESLQGLTVLNPAVELDLDNKVLHLRKLATDRVHVISGGGSGHEPSHAGMVGEGLLSAAVCGAPFASPSSLQITSALRRTIGSKGALLVVKQYTGDVLNFGLAKERFAATNPEDSQKVRMIVVGDDVAVGKKDGEMVGRRGLAGTCLVYKVAGALAKQGSTVEDIYDAATYVAANLTTIGASLEHCHVPGADKGKASLKDDEMEIGMGIHNEPGNRTANVTSANKLVSDLMHQLTSTSDPDRSFVPFKLDGSDEVILLVNNLGALPELELSIVVHEAAKWLHDSHFKVVRALAGTFMTSFGMPGFSISLLRLPRRDADESTDRELIVDALDAPTDAPGWKWMSGQEPSMEEFKKAQEKEKSKPPIAESDEARGPCPSSKDVLEAAIVSACKSVIDAEREITRFDEELGDGDCGQTLKAGAQGVLDGLNDLSIRLDRLSRATQDISSVLEQKMGGTSGALYCIFFSALSTSLAEQQAETGDAETWAKALEHALNSLLRYTRARPPSRTLIDPLSAFVSTLVYDSSAPGKAFDAAQEAAEATQFLEPKLGRSAYVGKQKVKEVPDWGVYKLLDGIRKGMAASEQKD